ARDIAVVHPPEQARKIGELLSVAIRELGAVEVVAADVAVDAPAVAIATGDLVRPVAAALPVHLAELPLGGALERFIERLAAGLLPPGNDARRFPVQALRRLLVEVLVARQDHLVAELITGRQQRLWAVAARPTNGTGERHRAVRRIATSTRRSTIAARSATALARSAAATGRAAVAAGARAS